MDLGFWHADWMNEVGVRGRLETALQRWHQTIAGRFIHGVHGIIVVLVR